MKNSNQEILSYDFHGQVACDRNFLKLWTCYKDIPIEERNSEELSHIEGLDENGNVKKIQIYPQKSKSMNLAFDITPAKYVTGLITEKGVCEASEKGLKDLFKWKI